VILFAPHNINLVIGTPQLRREEFDDYCSICDFKYALNLDEYGNVLRNRNRLLKAINEGKAGTSQLPYWNEKLIELGSKIIFQRSEIINSLKPIISRLAKEYLREELQDFDLVYNSKFCGGGDDTGADNADDDELKTIMSRFSEKLSLNIDTEIAAKQTLYGPQKDDYTFILDKQYDLKTFGSRGQQRMITLILKLAMWEHLFFIKETKPIILLDDIMSELDEGNKKILEKIIDKLACQTFITTTHEKDFSKIFRDKINITKLGE
jgi:DNA replication and repair protein RecF